MGFNSLLRQRQPWGKFFLKASIVITLIISLGFAFTSRYRIGIDSQVIKCIPGVTFYLIDLKDKQLERNKIFAFSSRGTQPFFEDGTTMVKYLRGMEGDRIKIDKDQNILINDKQQGWGLFLSTHLEQSPTAFMGEKTLAENELWFMGEHDLSFDSRYWGMVHNEQIIGRAYPLF